MLVFSRRGSILESDQGEVTSTTGNRHEIVNKDQTAVGSINKNVQILLKNKLEKKNETLQDRCQKERNELHNTDFNNNGYIMDFGYQEYSPDIGSNSLTALSELCDKIKQNTFTLNSQVESVNMIGKDKAKCRKLNRLEKLRKAWNESLMTQGQNNISLAEYAQSSYQPACNIKHCNKNCWALQSPTGFGEGMSGNDRHILQLDSPVYTQHQIHSKHGYQMMSPKIADEAEVQPGHSNLVADSQRWTDGEDFKLYEQHLPYQNEYQRIAESRSYPRSDIIPWVYADTSPTPQQGYHGFRVEDHSSNDRSQFACQHQHPTPHSQFYQPDSETYYQDTPLNFSSSATQSRNSLDDAVEGLLNLSSSQDTD